MKIGLLKLCDKASFYSLAFIIFFLPVYNSFTSLGIGLAILCFLIKVSLSPRLCPNFIKKWPIIAFLIVSGLSIINSCDISLSLIGLRKLMMHFFVFLAIAAGITDIRRLKYLIFVLLFSAFIVSLDGFWQHFTGTDWFSFRPLMAYTHLGIKRITASFWQAGSLGIHIGAVIPVSLSLFLFYLKGFKKIMLGIMTFVLISILVLSFAPGAAFGVSAAIIFFACAKKEWRLTLFLMLGVLLAYFILPESLTNWPNGSLFQTIFGRIKMWAITVKMIQIHPFFGNGLHTFGVNYQKLCVPGDPYYGLGPPYAHNMYVQMAAEIGLLGLFSFIALIAGIFKKLWYIYRATEEKFVQTLSLGLIGSFIAYLTHGMLESSLYTSQSALLFWILSGFSISLLNFKIDVDF
ncbi:MAG: hypothetical protein AUJ74_06110 [Candidatus Omnitrophica bacterium CG1_02_44_16]|nr:MAG: hypothetical protein AUJ74_06110 [Candidatus Omnitrophica bacterium CG1_02_44_16]PIY83055.1 MAG: hypothetical protein COY78_03705 [Candidatus Omnitrophica bacterium CG_4_10_14_0_8_um_filter_44_12]PIZ83382.1 MAG: hypothetical protein COX96_08125 [Candidatus Omnitrophica bacterium CG_4_10_14_0_2_um_filter_44_9]